MGSWLLGGVRLKELKWTGVSMEFSVVLLVENCLRPKSIDGPGKVKKTLGTAFESRRSLPKLFGQFIVLRVIKVV